MGDQEKGLRVRRARNRSLEGFYAGVTLEPNLSNIQVIRVTENVFIYRRHCLNVSRKFSKRILKTRVIIQRGNLNFDGVWLPLSGSSCFH